ncbi:hypothetical protein [Idiomarina xiamenensis]|uniref:Lipoprotein n=1 Tax=Idiomarina xiamenensis 10-D-4 TaxID=740709 RepID=K2KI23_9GAMM|nr:hypothetical protein [Idiomarina xiamenensis]EKE87573.1 hypothetical protein A10D4_00725 [Idiomarina xiamenensis 10-D-4]
MSIGSALRRCRALCKLLLLGAASLTLALSLSACVQVSGPASRAKAEPLPKVSSIALQARPSTLAVPSAISQRLPQRLAAALYQPQRFSQGDGVILSYRVVVLDESVLAVEVVYLDDDEKRLAQSTFAARLAAQDSASLAQAIDEVSEAIATFSVRLFLPRQ